MIFGYCRVSTQDQNLDRQIVELENQVDRMYCDKKSGKDTNREQLQSMMMNIRKDDKILCLSLDRLSRNLTQIIQLVEEINNKGAAITFIKENLTFTPNHNDPFQKLMLSMLGSINEFYRNNLLEVQRAGIKLAKEQGKYAKPRAKKLNRQQVVELKELAKTTSISGLAKKFGVSRPTVYQYLK